MDNSNSQNDTINNNDVGNNDDDFLSSFFSNSSHLIDTRTLVKWTDAEFATKLEEYNDTVSARGFAAAYESDSTVDVTEFIDRQATNLRHYYRLGGKAPHMETLHSTVYRDVAQYRYLRAQRIQDIEFLTGTEFDIRLPHEHPINDDRNPNVPIEVAIVRSVLFTDIETLDDMLEVLISGMKLIEKAIMKELKCCLQDDLRAVYELEPLRPLTAQQEIRALGRSRTFDLSGLRIERHYKYRVWRARFRARLGGRCPRCDRNG